MITKNEYERGMKVLLEDHGIQYLTAHELCPAGKVYKGVTLQVPPRHLWPNILPAALMVDEARRHFGVPFHVNSGYRDTEYNRAVGSTSRNHVEFRALDFWSPDVDTRTIADWMAGDRRADRTWMGLYPSFIHVDIGLGRRRW